MRRNILILTLALIAAACGGADGTNGGGGSDPTTTTRPLDGPDEAYPMLTVEDVGGFVPVQFNLKRVPRYVLMSDGALYMQAPTTMQFPGPAVVPIQTGTVDQATLDEIRSAIEAAGLNEIDDQSNDAASAQVADASTTVFTYVDAEGDEHRFAIYALGMPEIDYGDAAVSDFEDLLGLMEEAAGTAGDTQLWTPDAVEVFVSPEGLGFDQEFANTQTYPLSMSFDELPAESESAGYRCTTLEGDQAAQLLDAMSEGNEATTFVTDSGDEYSIIVRPLLPGQEGC